MALERLTVWLLSRSYPPAAGGVATHVGYLAEALRTLGKVNIHVITTKSDKPRSSFPPNLLIHDDTGERGHFVPEGEIACGQALQGLLKLADVTRPHVLHAHDFESILLGSFLKATLDIPLVATVHRTPKDWEHTKPARDIKDCFMRAVQRFRFADEIVAPGKTYRKHLLDQGFRNVRVINHGVPVLKLASSSSQPKLLETLGIDAADTVVFSPARLDRHKAPDLFVRAAGIVQRQRPDRKLVFVLAGYGEDRAYREEIEEQARREQVRFHLGIDGRNLLPTEMPTLYRRTTACVLPSRWDGFPLAILEALVFAKPTVGSMTGGIREMISPERTGLLFVREDADDLAYQLGRLLDMPVLTTRLGQTGLREVKTKYAAERMAREHQRLYRELARHAQRRRTP